MRPPRVSVPVARLLTREPSDAMVRWVMRATWLVLASFLVLVLIGNHVPRG